MIKIEQLKGGCTATIQRNGVKQPVYVGMVVTKAEIESLELSQGTLVYTIDEQEIVEVGQKAPLELSVNDTVSATTEIPSLEVQDTISVELTVAEDEAPKAVVKPAIVKPAPRAKSK